MDLNGRRASRSLSRLIPVDLWIGCNSFLFLRFEIFPSESVRAAALIIKIIINLYCQMIEDKTKSELKLEAPPSAAAGAPLFILIVVQSQDFFFLSLMIGRHHLKSGRSLTPAPCQHAWVCASCRKCSNVLQTLLRAAVWTRTLFNDVNHRGS